MDKVTILFLAADPSDAARLRLGQELRDIREKLQLSKQREYFSLHSRESVRPGDITQAIFDVEPQIVHFSGHGMGTGDLCFEDVLGKTHPVQSEVLASLFELVSEQVSCVVLNSCYSERQAKSIAQHIPFVIGMNQAIGDKAAIAFAVGFYKALGAGRLFKDAYKFACVEIQLQGVSEHLTPILFQKQNRSSSTSSLQINNLSGYSSNLRQRGADSFQEVSDEFGEIVIHEFSTGIVPIKFENGAWYSQGFTGGWMNSTLASIPSSVEQAIAKGMFGVDYLSNEKYPAIVAHVVADSTGIWSVIALVIRCPDRAGRYFCAYRYFLCEGEDSLCKLASWLEEQHLLYGRYPTFDPFDKRVIGSPRVCKLCNHVRNRMIPEEHSWIEGINPPIILPFGQPFSLYKINQIAHAKAAQEQSWKVSWAFNVRVLSKPKSFLVIHTTDFDAYERFIQIS
ncbi:hypothetical protein [Nodosilinea sp. E11]|uniref:hypothetical protein n=1 Tax=Nodosilinea sp. E11 TaxID=3037479 RepID=UPI002934FFF8|nr:hypothetical protein [Nodosilinea sp. E11]WOD37176.1 hypothetical protein RRF56_01585 [Nodosilinea sp. E11]